VLIDTGAYFNQRNTLEVIRRYSKDRINTAIYTHGHVDHACGMPAFVAEAGPITSRALEWSDIARWRRASIATSGPSVTTASRTRGSSIGPRCGRPSTFIPIPISIIKLNVVAGNHKFECHHARGETDDHCWIYFAQAKVLFTGDLIIWAAPNAGNPQRRNAMRASGPRRCARWRSSAPTF